MNRIRICRVPWGTNETRGIEMVCAHVHQSQEPPPYCESVLGASAQGHESYLFMGRLSKMTKNWSTYFITDSKLDFHTGHVPSSETDALKKKSYLFFSLPFLVWPLGHLVLHLETLFPGGLFWDFRSIYNVNI